MQAPYIKQLDALRFYSVLMIMVAHWAQIRWTNPILKNIPFVHGVIVFFVLSGFLITSILLKNKENYSVNKLDMKKLLKIFYIRRFLRITPIYYIIVLFLLAINFKNIHTLLPWLLTFTSNIYQSIYNVSVDEFNHFWSLAVEEQFYLFWPILILFTKNKTLTIIAVTIAIALLTRTYLYLNFNSWRATAYFTICCMHSLSIGALLAYISIYKIKLLKTLQKQLWLYLSLFVYVGLLIIQVLFDLEWYKQIVDEFVFSIFTMFFILKVSTTGFSGFGRFLFENKLICYFGRISYGLYLFHAFVPSLIYWGIPAVKAWNNEIEYFKYFLFLLFFVVTVFLAHFSFKYLESPINNLKKKFPYSSNEEAQ